MQRISGAVVQVLLSILNDIKDDISSMKRDISNLKETMTEHHDTLRTLNLTLSQQHENLGTVSQTLNDTLSTQLASLQASVDGSYTKMDALNSKLTANMRQEFRSFETQTIAPALDTIWSSLNTTLVSMKGDLSLDLLNDTTNRICYKVESMTIT